MQVFGWDLPTVTITREKTVGFILLLAAFGSGAILRKSGYITDGPVLPEGTPGCDSYISSLCIPTLWFQVPIGSYSVVINLMSLVVTIIFFLLGTFLLGSDE